MAGNREIQEFLTPRRARLTPAQVGLVSYGRRRVPGLRREEVALLAQVSTGYYGRLERGNVGGMSESILQALVGALRLSADEEQHLRDLIRSGKEPPVPRQRKRPAQPKIRPSTARMLDAMVDLPAVIQTGRLDVVAANELGRALYNDVFDTPAAPPNFARFLFLDPRAGQFAPDWDRAANDVIATLRAAVGRDPDDRRLSDLIGELSTHSDEFPVRWAKHNVVQRRSGTTRVYHPVVGILTLDLEMIHLQSNPPMTMTVFGAESSRPSHDGLTLLANWAASRTHGAAQVTGSTDSEGIPSPLHE